jgi:hypothetical protein
MFVDRFLCVRVCDAPDGRAGKEADCGSDHQGSRRMPANNLPKAAEQASQVVIFNVWSGRIQLIGCASCEAIDSVTAMARRGANGRGSRMKCVRRLISHFIQFIAGGPTQVFRSSLSLRHLCAELRRRFHQIRHSSPSSIETR